MLRSYLRDVLLLLVSLACALFTALLRPVAGELFALACWFLWPIAVCLYRTAMAPAVPGSLSAWRAAVAQVALALSLIVLLIFDLAAGMLANLLGAPPSVWLVLAGIGATYLTLSGTANRILRYG